MIGGGGNGKHMRSMRGMVDKLKISRKGAKKASSPFQQDLFSFVSEVSIVLTLDSLKGMESKS